MNSANKPIFEQVLFITGATSEVGEALVELATKKGAKVFMVGRNEDHLQSIQDKMRQKNFHTAFCVADVAEIDQLQMAVDQCLATFGRVDTWINGIAPIIISDEDLRDFFETHFWGLLHSVDLAKRVMADQGGRIMNLSIPLGEESSPLHETCEALNLSIAGLSESLRKKLLKNKPRVTLTYIHMPDSRPEVMASTVLKMIERSSQSFWRTQILRMAPNLRRMRKNSSGPVGIELNEVFNK